MTISIIRWFCVGSVFYAFVMFVSHLFKFIEKTRSPSEVPRIELPQELFVNLAVSVGSEINKVLGFLQDVACKGNLKQFLLVFFRILYPIYTFSFFVLIYLYETSCTTRIYD